MTTIVDRTPRRHAGSRRWYRGDCHVHSTLSHGAELGIDQLVADADAAGLDFLASTEHNTTAGHAAWVSATDGPLVIVGQEVVTGDGHWLALGVEPGHLVDWRYGAQDHRIEREVATVHRMGGLCVAAHPHAPYPSGAFRYSLEGFDLVEVWNGRWSSDLPWQADNAAALDDWADHLATAVARGRWRPAIGSSDTHLAGQLGRPHTVVLSDERSDAAILAALRAGRSWMAARGDIELSFTATAGGRTAEIGDVLSVADEPVTAQLTVGGAVPGTVGLHTATGVALEVPVPDAGSGRWQWRIDAAGALFVRVEVRTDAGDMQAMTNPIVVAGT